MKKIIFSFSLCLTFGLVMSQSCGQLGPVQNTQAFSLGSLNSINPNFSHLQNLTNDIRTGKYLSSATEYSNIEGAPYLQEEGSVGTLVMNDDASI